MGCMRIVLLCLSVTSQLTFLRGVIFSLICGGPGSSILFLFVYQSDVNLSTCFRLSRGFYAVLSVGELSTALQQIPSS